jgi:hypothetical protein
MDMSKRVTTAMSGLVLAGAAALSVATTTPAGAGVRTAAPQKGHDHKKPHHDKHSDDGGAGGPGGNGGGGGGGGGVNIYHPNQNYDPAKDVEED